MRHKHNCVTGHDYLVVNVLSSSLASDYIRHIVTIAWTCITNAASALMGMVMQSVTLPLAQHHTACTRTLWLHKNTLLAQEATLLLAQEHCLHKKHRTAAGGSFWDTNTFVSLCRCSQMNGVT